MLAEEAARTFEDSRDPYAASFRAGPLGAWPGGTPDHMPYMPGFILFGMLRVLVGAEPLTDARLSFAVVAAASAGAALALSKSERRAWAFIVWSPRAFFEEVIAFPLGLTKEATLAESPTVGRLLTRAFPSAGPAIALASGLVVGAVAILLMVRRPPQTASQAAMGTAVVFVLAVLLATAGRFGYLVYPLNLAVWSRTLVGAGAVRDASPVASYRLVPSRDLATRPAKI